MAKINLLPWRAERRKARQQEFMTMLGVAAAAGVMISLLIVMYYIGQIDGQNNRNTYLAGQITELDKQIAEIAELDKKKAGLLKRKQVIEELQASRSQMVHLFDELARTIADGTQIVSLEQNGPELTLLGRAQSNARVSTYMRNLDASGWMGSPDLGVIELKSADPGLPNEFSLKVKLKNPNDPETGTTTTVQGTDVPAETTPPPGPVETAPASASSVAAPPPAMTPSAAPTPPATAPDSSSPPANPAGGGNQ